MTWALVYFLAGSWFVVPGYPTRADCSAAAVLVDTSHASDPTRAWMHEKGAASYCIPVGSVAELVTPK